MKELTKEQATRRVRDLQEIMDTCYEAAGVIVSAHYEEGFQRGWTGEAGIQRLTHYVIRLENLLKNLSRSKARTSLARELFSAVIRGDLTIEDVKEGSEANGEIDTEA